MTPWLAAIDLEALVWGVLAVIYIIAQIAGRFRQQSGPEEDGAPRRGVPDEIREFLEEIQGRAAAAEDEEDWPPPPPQKTRPAPPPIRQAQPASMKARPVNVPAPAKRSSAQKTASRDKIASVLERRQHQFRCQLQKQADHLSKAKRLIESKRGSTIGKAPEMVEHQEGLTYLSAGIKGFKLPNLGLPGGTASLQNRRSKHHVSIGTPDNLRKALIHTILLGPPVASEPPGCQELTRQKQ